MEMDYKNPGNNQQLTGVLKNREEGHLGRRERSLLRQTTGLRVKPSPGIPAIGIVEK